MVAIQVLSLAFLATVTNAEITHQLPLRPKHGHGPKGPYGPPHPHPTPLGPYRPVKHYGVKPKPYTPAPYHATTPYHPSPAPYKPSPAPLVHPVKPINLLPHPVEKPKVPVKPLPPHPVKPYHPDPYYQPDHYDDGPSNYAFGYSVNDEYTGEDFSHTETRDGYTTSGEYSVALPDGRIQIVTYYADDSGYHADVKYEGVAAAHPVPLPLHPAPAPYKPHPSPAPYKPTLSPAPYKPHPAPYKPLPAPTPYKPLKFPHPAPLPVKPVGIVPPQLPAPAQTRILKDPKVIGNPLPEAVPAVPEPEAPEEAPEPAPIVTPVPAPAAPPPSPIHRGLPRVHHGPAPHGGYPRALPHIRDHAPLPKAYLPTPTPHYLPKPTPYHYKKRKHYTPSPYAPTVVPHQRPTPTPKWVPLKSIHLKPAVYKPKPDPYAAKVGSYIG